MFKIKNTLLYAFVFACLLMSCQSDKKESSNFRVTKQPKNVVAEKEKLSKQSPKTQGSLKKAIQFNAIGTIQKVEVQNENSLNAQTIIHLKADSIEPDSLETTNQSDILTFGSRRNPMHDRLTKGMRLHIVGRETPDNPTMAQYVMDGVKILANK